MEARMELTQNVIDVNANLSKTTPCSNEHILLLNNTKSYSAIASCVLEHIITNSNLNESERLYYIYLDLKSNYNLSKKRARNASISATTSSKHIGLSESTIFRLQLSLENKGYLSIKRGNNLYGANIITPTLPQNVFDLLVQASSRTNPGTITSNVCFRSYLDSNKMFVPINYQQIDFLIKTKELTGLQKLIWLFLYTRSFLAEKSSNKRRATITQPELCEIFKCSQPTISKALTNLANLGFINKDRYDVKLQTEEELYTIKSVFFVEALFPLNAMENLLANQPNRDKIAHNINKISALNARIHNSILTNDLTQNKQNNYSEMNDVYSQMDPHYSQMHQRLFPNASHSNRNITLKSFNNKNISNTVDVVIKNDDLNNALDFSVNIVKSNLNDNLDIQPKEVSSDSKTNEDIEAGKFELKKIMQMLKGSSKVDSNSSNSTVNSIDLETKAQINQELKEAQERRINSLLSISSNIDTQQQENNIKSEKIETNTIKTLEMASFNVLNNVDKKELNETANENTKSDDIWAFAVDIINEKLHQNIAKLTSEQVLKATNFAKKLKKETQNLPQLRNIDENELIKQFIHHAANFKMTKLRCTTRDDEVNAALNFAFNAAKKGFWAQPADWGKAMELHLKREQLRYAFDADKEIFEFELELKKYLAAA
jgi:hypothetical protein